jgi:hypothetical protein
MKDPKEICEKLNRQMGLVAVQKKEEPSELERKIFEGIVSFAKKMHKGECRKTGKPYIEHPKNVCYLLEEVANEFHRQPSYSLLSAAMLHDVIENEVKKSGSSNFDVITYRLSGEIFSICYKNAKLDESRNKEKTKKFFNYVINVVYKLTKKPETTYFDYLHDIFYGKESVGEVNRKILKLLDEKKPIRVEGPLNLFYDFVLYRKDGQGEVEDGEEGRKVRFSRRDKNIITMYAIELKLADMYDNIASLPPENFDVQTALYSFYKGIMLSNEIRRKFGLLEKEMKYYGKAQRLADKLLELIKKQLDCWIKHVEQFVAEDERQKNYESLEEYDKAGGFERLTRKGKSYFDGTMERYARMLIGEASKETFGFENIDAKQINLIGHRDLIGFRRFVEKIEKEKPRHIFCISNLLKWLEKNKIKSKNG